MRLCVLRSEIDFVVADVIGREWQLGTVQVDYQLPERFELDSSAPTPNRIAGHPSTAPRSEAWSVHRRADRTLRRRVPAWLSRAGCGSDHHEKSNESRRRSAASFSSPVCESSRTSTVKNRRQDPRGKHGENPLHAGIGEKEAAENKVAVRTRAGRIWDRCGRQFQEMAKQESRNGGRSALSPAVMRHHASTAGLPRVSAKSSRTRCERPDLKSRMFIAQHHRDGVGEVGPVGGVLSSNRRPIQPVRPLRPTVSIGSG